jgi:hypothetical protein
VALEIVLEGGDIRSARLRVVHDFAQKKPRAGMTGGAKAVRGANHRPATLWAGVLYGQGAPALRFFERAVIPTSFYS